MANGNRPSGNVLVVTIACIFLFTVAGVVTIAVAIPDGGRAGSLVALLIGMLAPTVGVIATLSKVNEVQVQARANGEKTERLMNGEMNRKIQENVHYVLNQRQKGLTQPPTGIDFTHRDEENDNG